MSRPSGPTGATVRIRPARASDRAAVISMTAGVWEGTDYVPLVWDSWLHDAAGILLVAEQNGAIVGLEHLAAHDQDTAWLEGIRVAPSARGAGVAQRLLAAHLEWAAQAGIRVARLSTSSSNLAAQRVAEGAGFALRQTYLPMRADPARQEDVGVQVGPAFPWEAGRVLELLTGASGPDDPVYVDGWTAYPLNEAHLCLLLAMQSVVRAGSPPQAAMIVTSHVDRPILSIGATGGPALVAEGAARWVLDMAARTSMRSVRAMVPEESEALIALRSAGFEQSRDFQMLLYERQL